jgi:uncharacterized protein YqhQ
MVGFMAMLRFMPRMAGYHAAEHQTVNAIEAGAPLTPQAVSRHPRVHPRCGTNLWAFMTLTYLGVSLVSMLLATEFGRAHLSLVMSLVVGYVLFVALFWRRVGAWLQTHITTRRATPKELASGIRAGEELLRRHLAGTGEAPRPFERVWRMGLAQVMIGVMITGFIMQLLQSPLDKLLDYLVR